VSAVRKKLTQQEHLAKDRAHRMTPAEELLAAVKEHATAKDTFEFVGGKHPTIHALRFAARKASVGRLSDGQWYEDVYGPKSSTYRHDSASSAVYSAFLRARK